ncbi:MAG: glutathionylspermidine synthase family protein [Flavipsychrobacter sp.]|nr:glutathionylspermidine synthase family protein [Flavipsychrobacter sp.]
MKRHTITPRINWEQIMQEQGFLFYNDEGYYNESAVYEFSAVEIAEVERATAEIYRMCLAAVDYAISNKLWKEFIIPRKYWKLIEWSLRRQQPSFYGRFDLAFNKGQLKLLEFNADTPTLLLESSVVQWRWLQDHNPQLDQYNRIHESLLVQMCNCQAQLLPGKLFFTAPDNPEDYVTARYMQDVAMQAGIETEFIYIHDIAIDHKKRFVTPAGEPINNIYKLYPYEWLFDEPFGRYLLTNIDTCYWIEPPYKVLLSNKMILKYVYMLFPDSPYILPCKSSMPKPNEPLFTSYARKPIYSREGENIQLVTKGHTIEETHGEYGEEGYIYQQYFELPEFDGRHPILGSWVIGGKPAGMGIRESTGRITNVTSSFCSHYIAP